MYYMAYIYTSIQYGIYTHNIYICSSAELLNPAINIQHVIQATYLPLFAEGCDTSARRILEKNQRLAAVTGPLHLAIKRRLVLAWQDVHAKDVLLKLAIARAAGAQGRMH